jgi:hypothetical protein
MNLKMGKAEGEKIENGKCVKRKAKKLKIENCQ